VRLRARVDVAEDGSFTVDLPGGRWPADPAFAVARAEGWAPTALVLAAEQVERLSEERVIGDVVVSMHRGATVEGVVTSTDGAALPDAHVGFTADPYAREPDDDQASTTTDGDGRYRLAEADPRRALYLVVARDGQWMRPVLATSSLVAGATRTLDVRMAVAESADLVLRVDGPEEAARVVLDGGFPMTAASLRDVPVATGPHRARLVDAEGKTLVDAPFDVPPGSRAALVDLRR
jgi:hypothetical protein